METSQEPKLEKPGSGLPWLEAVVTRYWVFPRATRSTSWDHSNARFERETQKILSLVSSLAPTQLETRVLIKRFTGIEDSSRYWSIAMTLEHLMIVGKGMVAIISELGHGREPLIKADVAQVKPKGALQGPKLVEEFRDSMSQVASQVGGDVGDRRSKLRHRHPWFGKITAHEWNWLLGAHQGIHRRQIEKILAGMRAQ